MRHTATRLSVLAVAALVALAGCTPIRLASDYDERIDEAASTLQQEMDAYLTTLEALGNSSEAEFSQNEDFYRDYAVALRSVRLRAQGHRKNELTLQQLDRMSESLEELEEQHRQSNILSSGYTRAVRDLFNSAWGAVIAWEIAKKRGGE